MKKLLWLSFSVVLFLFGISHIEAKTLLQTSKGNNGEVGIALAFEEGYIGGIDLTLEVSEQASLIGIRWNDALAKAPTKKYTYDATTHKIKIVVATGNQTINLVDKNGMMQIGTLIFQTTNGNTVRYTLDMIALTIVDATYSSIKKDDFSINGSREFLYQVNNNTNNDNTSTDENQSNGESGNYSNQTESTNSSNKNTQNSISNTQKKNQTTINESKEAQTEKKESSEEEKKESTKVEDENSNSSTTKKPTNSNSNQNDKKEKNEKKKVSVSGKVGIAVIVLLVLSLITMALKRFKL